MNFTQRIDSLPQQILMKIAKIDELKGQWAGGVRLHPQVLSRLKKFVLVTSTGASTRIEGARLSDEDVEKLMRGISIQRLSDRDKQEVKGYFELLRNIFDSWETIKFSENSIKHLHRELLKHVSKDKLHRGEYKKKENKVLMVNEAGQSIGVLFDTTPPYLTLKETQELIETTNKAFEEQKYHPLLVIANFLVEFLHIHPFEDGNGRISRILTNLLLLQKGYVFVPYVSHEKLIEDNKPDYYMALRKSQKTLKTKKADILPWLDFFLTIMLQQAQTAIDLLSKENIEKILSPKQLAVWEFLQTVTEASPKEISAKTKVALPTIAQTLNKLLQLKKVERFGLGRSTRYKKI